MWPLTRPKRPKHPPPTTTYRAYLRGRLSNRIDDAEIKLYTSAQVSMRLQVAFAIGACAKRHAPILSEAQVNRAVRDRLDLEAMVASVEGGDDPQGGSPPPVPVPLGVEQTATVRWIGEPLPSSA